MADKLDGYYYEPAQGHGLPHNPFNAIIGPRPIGWIATRGANAGLPPRRVQGTIQIRSGPLEVEDTLITWEKKLAVDSGPSRSS